MEDLKLEEDDATPEAAQGPSPFGPGPLPRTLFFRETGVSPWQARGKRTVVTAPPKPHNNRRLQDEVVEEVDSDEEQGTSLFVSCSVTGKILRFGNFQIVVQLILVLVGLSISCTTTRKWTNLRLLSVTTHVVMFCSHYIFPFRPIQNH